MCGLCVCEAVCDHGDRLTGLMVRDLRCQDLPEDQQLSARLRERQSAARHRLSHISCGGRSC